MKTAKFFAILMFLSATALVVASCGSDDPTVSTGSTFSGAIAGPAGDTGTLLLTIGAEEGAAQTRLTAKAGDFAVSGTLTLSGSGAIALTGTFDPTTSVFSVSGGGYDFTGTLADESVSGTYTGPNGNGTFAVQDSSSATVTVFCGTFSGSSPGGSISGTWNCVISSTGAVNGTSFGTGSGFTFSDTFTGSVSGSSISITAFGDFDGTATGTISGNNVSGDWEGTGDDAGADGSFSGSTGSCPS